MAALSSTSCLHSLAGHERYFLSCNSPQFSKPLFINPSLKKPRFSVPFCIKQSDREERQIQQESSRVEEEEEEEEYWVVTAVRSKYNEIVIVDTVDSRYLLLDSTSKLFIFKKKLISLNPLFFVTLFFSMCRKCA